MKKKAEKIYSDYDKKHSLNLNKKVKSIDDLFNSFSKEMAKIGSTIELKDPSKPFSFDDYPAAKTRADKLISKLQKQILGTVQTGNAEEWDLSNAKNDSVVDMITSSTKLTKEQISGFKLQNIDAFNGFQSRKVNGLDLSTRVWSIVEQTKSEIELSLDIGIGEGKSAAELSLDIRQNLKNPNMLFRRVRDKYGNLKLSKQAKAYHPGQGVYRSSYKNALRLTATENNMAYRMADHTRWNQTPWILGYDILLSNNHPIPDICDDLQGRYPVNFVFLGWHPFCRCKAVPVLAKMEDFIKYQQMMIDDEDVSGFKFEGRVTETPKQLKSWIGDNQERIDKMKQKGKLPYFIRDNETYFKAA